MKFSRDVLVNVIAGLAATVTLWLITTIWRDKSGNSDVILLIPALVLIGCILIGLPAAFVAEDTKNESTAKTAEAINKITTLVVLMLVPLMIIIAIIGFIRDTS